jgi:hypothetical protein
VVSKGEDVITFNFLKKNEKKNQIGESQDDGVRRLNKKERQESKKRPRNLQGDT